MLLSPRKNPPFDGAERVNSLNSVPNTFGYLHAIHRDGGVDGLVVENYGDAPFYAADVPKHVVAEMTREATAVTETVDCPVGINVLRNDAAAALSVADGAIVGTALKDGGETTNPVDRDRVRSLVAAAPDE